MQRDTINYYYITSVLLLDCTIVEYLKIMWKNEEKPCFYFSFQAIAIYHKFDKQLISKPI